MQIYVSGPYGELAVDLEGSQYKSVIFVSGGIGITPMQSVCNELLDQHKRGREMLRMWFVWSVADKFMVNSMYDETYAETEAMAKLPLPMPKSFQPNLLKRAGSHRVSYDPYGALENGKPGAEQKDQESQEQPMAEDGEVLSSHIYLTRVTRDKSEFELAGIMPDVQPHLHFGRPKFDDIFSTAQTLCAKHKDKGGDRVAVLCCGPVTMIRDVRLACLKYSNEDVQFDYHHEVRIHVGVSGAFLVGCCFLLQ